MGSTDRAMLRQQALLDTLVPMSWLNYPALLGFPLVFLALAGTRLDPAGGRLWVGAVWLGSFGHTGLLLLRRWWQRRWSARAWELVFAAAQLVASVLWASALFIDRDRGTAFGIDMLMIAVLMVPSVAAVVGFSGSLLTGRLYLTGLWWVYSGYAVAHQAAGRALFGLTVWAAALAYHHLMHRILARTVDDRLTAAELADALAVQATTDALTGLLNRSAFVAEVDRMLDRTAMTLLFIDLDGFKDVNDGLGHARGDEVLVTVADRLRQVVRTADIVGRLGGDEFVVALPGGLATSGVDAIVERVGLILAQPVGHDPPVTVTASIGIAESGGAVTTEEILGRADLAMYTAKGSGGQGARYYEVGQADRRRDQLALARDLPGALERGEIVAHAQPIVALATGEALGYELLARWIRPDGTLIPPADFVPLAEDHGLDQDLGRLMLDHAARAAAASGLAFGVNVTPAHLLSGRLHDDLVAALARHGARPELFVIEITESQVVTDMARAGVEVRRIEALGAAVAIDDFGTGGSSMALAEQLPCRYLKVAPELAFRLHTGERPRTVLRSIAELGHGLGFRVMVEGIETQEVADLVASIGIVRGQGYHFARPRPLEEVLARSHHRYGAGSGTGSTRSPVGGSSR